MVNRRILIALLLLAPATAAADCPAGTLVGEVSFVRAGDTGNPGREKLYGPFISRT